MQRDGMRRREAADQLPSASLRSATGPNREHRTGSVPDDLFRNAAEEYTRKPPKTVRTKSNRKRLRVRACDIKNGRRRVPGPYADLNIRRVPFRLHRRQVLREPLDPALKLGTSGRFRVVCVEHRCDHAIRGWKSHPLDDVKKHRIR